MIYTQISHFSRKLLTEECPYLQLMANNRNTNIKLFMIDTQFSLSNSRNVLESCCLHIALQRIISNTTKCDRKYLTINTLSSFSDYRKCVGIVLPTYGFMVDNFKCY